MPDPYESSTSAPASRCWIVWLLIALPIGILFAPALLSNVSFATRDTGHFYHPLFQWTRAEWGSGRVPLWNPLDAGGMPVVADGSSSVFYPGKLLFALPLPFPLGFKLYIVGHVILAAIGAFRLARSLHGSTHAAALAATAYGCGGSVAFQYCNVVFLVGAAWLPWAWLAMLALTKSQGWRDVVLLGVVLALMILGGDPQMAVHVLLAGLLYLVVDAFGRNTPQPVIEDLRRPANTRRTLWALGALAAAAGVSFALAAVQILPSREAARGSTRSVVSAPRNIYEALDRVVSPPANKDLGASPALPAIAAGLFGSPPQDSHGRDIYAFSVGPWRFVELVWPNVFGRMFPQHRRWLDELPAEGRIWTPTLYMGLLTSVLGLWQLRPRSADLSQRWLTWTFLLFALGSIGWYGLGWFAREFYASVLGGDSNRLGIGQPVGGMYWFLVTLVPGYDQFRYPAKLFVVASLALSMLAARGWDRAQEGRSTIPIRMFQGLLALSLLGLLIASFPAERWFLQRAWQGSPAFGPFDLWGSLFDLRLAFAHTATVCAAAAWFLMNRSVRESIAWRVGFLGFAVLELAVANRWFVATAPADVWRTESLVASAFQGRAADPPRIYRTRASSWWPGEFARNRSPERMAEICAWEHDSLFPKHHLLSGAVAVDSSSSIRPSDRDSFWRVAQGLRRPHRWHVPHGAALRLVGTEYVAAPKSFVPGAEEGWQEIEVPRSLEPDLSLWRIPDPRPAAWIVHRVEALPPLGPSANTRAIEERTRRVLVSGGQPRDFSQVAVVETDEPGIEPAPSAEPLATPRCQVSRLTPQRWRVHADLDRPGLLVINQPFSPGWVARRTTADVPEELPILRTNRILQGVVLPAGRHTVELTYEPASFRIGGAISVAAWLAVFLAVGVSHFRRRR